MNKIKILSYLFEGLYHKDSDDILDAPGVYVVYDSNQKRMLDVGQSDKLQTRLKNHERTDCWVANGWLPDVPGICVLYIPSAHLRSRIEQKLRVRHKLPCGGGEK